MTRALHAFLRDDRGATAIEYALIVAFIFLAITGTLAALGDKVEQMWNTIGTAVANALS
jgi:pilus assembly protein Flp/PilA